MTTFVTNVNKNRASNMKRIILLAALIFSVINICQAQQEQIEADLSDFAEVRNVMALPNFAMVEYEHTFAGWDADYIREKTKEYMEVVLQSVISHTESERIRIAPYHPSQSGGFIAVALLTIERDEYVKGKDVESYPNFVWKDQETRQ